MNAIAIHLNYQMLFDASSFAFKALQLYRNSRNKIIIYSKIQLAFDFVIFVFGPIAATSLKI